MATPVVSLRSSAWRVAARFALATAAVLLLAFALFILTIGRWLVVEDPLEKARAIVVLSGRMPLRAMGAVDLYRSGYAPEVWLTQSAEPGESLQALGIPYNGEDFYDTRVLIHEGVPPQAIRVLPKPILNTAEELAAVAASLPADKSGVVIIVTSKVHTRRVRALWKRLGAARGRAIIRSPTEDPFDPAHWWRTSSDALDVLRECLGLLNAWAGLPLPAS